MHFLISVFAFSSFNSFYDHNYHCWFILLMTHSLLVLLPLLIFLGGLRKPAPVGAPERRFSEKPKITVRHHLKVVPEVRKPQKPIFEPDFSFTFASSVYFKNLLVNLEIYLPLLQIYIATRQKAQLDLLSAVHPTPTPVHPGNE